MNIPELDGVFLRQFRLALGMSMADAAAAFGVNQVSYKRWERGINPIPDGVRNDAERIYYEFLSDVAELRDGGQIDPGELWVEAAMFWASQNELQP